MKKIVALVCFLSIFIFGVQVVYADIGDIGFFGGITEGTRLPKTTEEMIAAAESRRPTRTLTNLAYKEMVFLSGQAVEMNCLMSMRQQGDIVDTENLGTYRVTYTITPVAANAAEGEDLPELSRNITFDVNWRREGNQIVKDYEAINWAEEIRAGGMTYTLDSDRSFYSVSILEDHTAGVVYAKGDLSVFAYYELEESGVTLDINGSFYGYNSAWSNTEVQRLNGQVYADDWQLEYQVRPSVSVNKMLQYSKNEPQAISFDGNYREIMQNTSGLSYNIYTLPQQFYGAQTDGSTSISTRNTFEQLPAYDLSAIVSHFAFSDIQKLFSMGIISGETSHYNPSQMSTRAQFVTMLVKAIKLPIEMPVNTRSTRNSNKTVTFTFPDVLPSRDDYSYIMAANKAGLAQGRGDGKFYADYPIQREEALVILLRTLGLSNLGLEPTNITPFTDDADISSWAKKEIYAAVRLGIILGDEMGRINPKTYVTKAEAAALVNRLIEYMREGLSADYAEHIVNYAD